MALLLRHANCIDPAVGFNQAQLKDILIRDGIIASINDSATTTDQAHPDSDFDGIEVYDLAGRLVVPGLMDMHVHLRDPGQEYKEDILSGARAAARGGFTAVLAMPNTIPTVDSGAEVGYVLKKASENTLTRIYQAGALTVGLKGQALSEMADMAEAGALAFSDDGQGLQDSGMMRLAMEYAATLDKPVLSHCQVNSLTASGQVNEGLVSTRLGLAGWPAAGEQIMVARDIALAELTGARLHIQHVSTAATVELVRAAKKRGVAVTAEVTPHHLFLSEQALDERYDTNLKMNPPLRTPADTEALQIALIEGVIDCVASDHAPHARHEKALEFELAPFGVIGLETALGLVLSELVTKGRMSLTQLVERMAHAPRRILGLPAVNLAVGSQADLTVIEPDYKWQVNADDFVSRSQNSAFIGRQLIGRASDVFVAGEKSLERGVVKC